MKPILKEQIKIRVSTPEDSEKVQLAAIQAGFRGFQGTPGGVDFLSAPWLWLESNNSFSYTMCKGYGKDHGAKQLSVKKVLKLLSNLSKAETKDREDRILSIQRKIISLSKELEDLLGESEQND